MPARRFISSSVSASTMRSLPDSSASSTASGSAPWSLIDFITLVIFATRPPPPLPLLGFFWTSFAASFTPSLTADLTASAPASSCLLPIIALLMSETPLEMLFTISTPGSPLWRPAASWMPSFRSVA